MSDKTPSLLKRWLGALLAPMAFLALLGLAAFVFMRSKDVNPLVGMGLESDIMVRFALKSVLCEILPLYLGVGLLLFVLAMVVARILWLDGKAWPAWNGWHAFWTTAGLLLLVHAILWWRVPTAIWVLPGISRLPMGLALFLIWTGAYLSLWLGLRWTPPSAIRRLAALLAWSGLAWSSLWLPSQLQRAGMDDSPAGHPARVLMISLDGLRQDIGLDIGLREFRGYRLENAYAAIPATRLEWSILWGGDARHYSVGNMMPDVTELEGKQPFEILDRAKKQGLKARFYIDDGGTIGLTDRTEAFDRVLMPARGWENFLNSNLASQVPLYAVWLDALRLFPTTNPWTPVDLGLRRALSDGRGADWVMYHSCLSHQPIFLTREELSEIPKWWARPARGMSPFLRYPSEQEVRSYRSEYSPVLAYGLRVRSILRGWNQVWSSLPQDPDYKSALRLMMTDHGERFYHLTPGIQMAGLHGYGLDPWELRIPVVLDGPEIAAGQDTTHAVSLLQIRDLVARRVLDGHPASVQDLLAQDHAVMRMYAIGLNLDLRADEYRQMKTEDIVEGSRIYPDGVWLTKFKQPEEVRERELTVAEAHGRTLAVWRPLKKGGAEHLVFDGYQLKSEQDVDEAEFEKVRARINQDFLVRWDQTPRGLAKP